MQQILHSQTAVTRSMTLSHRADGSVMRFHRSAWDHYHQGMLLDRLEHWQRAAQGKWFRKIIEIRREEEELFVEFPPLPFGFLPLREQRTALAERDHIQILLRLSEALAHLHQQGFIMGLLIPEQIYYHRATGAILLDVQPYPTAFPMVDHVLSDYPFGLLSPFSRYHTMPRIADFYGTGLLLHWLCLGRYPSEPWTVTDGLSSRLHALCKQLICTPETFLFASEIPERFHTSEECATQTSCEKNLPSGPEWLHPMPPAVMPDEQETLRAFLRKEGKRLIALVSQEEAVRSHVYNSYFNEVMERHLFFLIYCRNLPYATLREFCERTILFIVKIIPEAPASLLHLKQKFERIMSQHHTGQEITDKLSEWMYELYRELMPLFQDKAIYYTLEECEQFDEESQRVLLHFWRTYSKEFPYLFFMFSGREKPAHMGKSMVRFLTIGQKSADMYRRILLAQLGRADERLVQQLTDWFSKQQTDFSHSRLILESLVERGSLYLTPSGWQGTFNPDSTRHDPDAIIAPRLARMQEGDLQLLRTLLCLPRPIRAHSVWEACGEDTGKLTLALSRFDQWGLASVYDPNVIYISNDVAKPVLYDLPASEQTAYYERALRMQQIFRPSELPQLIELALQTGDQRLAYFYRLKYYRQIRSLLTLKQHINMLETLKQQQQALRRHLTIALDRLLYHIYMQLYLYEQATETARSLSERTGEAYDRFGLMHVLLFTGKLDWSAMKQELLSYLADTGNTLSDRARATHLLRRLPKSLTHLTKEEAETLDRFFRQEFYPQRDCFSRRLVAETTLSHLSFLIDLFPEQKEFISILLQQLESVLEGSAYHDLLIELYNCYAFQPNAKIAHTYNQQQLVLSRRFGFTTKEDLSYLNGMNIAICLGDPTEFRYLEACLKKMGGPKRADLQGTFTLNWLYYALEWQQWDQFRQSEKELLQIGLTDNASIEWEVLRRYAAFRRGEPLPPSIVWKKKLFATKFADALYEIESGQTAQAGYLLKQVFAENGDPIYEGWAIRELVALLVQSGSPESWFWLEQWKESLQTYGNDLFWPDYYRSLAIWHMQNGDRNRSLLSLRRAANLYRLIEKEDLYDEIMAEMERSLEPDYLEQDFPLRQHAQVHSLLQERRQLLEHSLDLQMIIELSRQVTKALDLTQTLERLTHALFEYFSVMLVAIDFHLLFRKERSFYKASGCVTDTLHIRYAIEQKHIENYVFPLCQQGNQSIKLEVYSQALTAAKREEIDHFLSFIRPHISNSLLHMEMVIDTLTSFYQRRYFLERMQQEFVLSKRYDLDLSIIMLDIDNFRMVNECGHQEGDKVLREVAAIVRGVLRQNDIPGRYGGEELLLILPKTDGKFALQIAEKIRKQIEEAFADRKRYKVTVSVGVSSLANCQANTIEELIRLADDAEITAKQSGKNRVVAAWLTI